ncbi:hypothetical protein Plhal304r1_c073g0161071 [Plasmopara halstedii]
MITHDRSGFLTDRSAGVGGDDTESLLRLCRDALLEHFNSPRQVETAPEPSGTTCVNPLGPTNNKPIYSSF